MRDRVNLNTATAEEMMPVLGHIVAGGIEEYRRLFGCFRDVSELQRVRGVGAKTYEKVKDLVCA